MTRGWSRGLMPGRRCCGPGSQGACRRCRVPPWWRHWFRRCCRRRPRTGRAASRSSRRSPRGVVVDDSGHRLSGRGAVDLYSGERCILGGRDVLCNELCLHIVLGLEATGGRVDACADEHETQNHECNRKCLLHDGLLEFGGTSHRLVSHSPVSGPRRTPPLVVKWSGPKSHPSGDPWPCLHPRDAAHDQGMSEEHPESSASAALAFPLVLFGFIGVLALVVALIVGMGSDSTSVSTNAVAAVSLSDSPFAISPEMISATTGGGLDVTNGGSMQHNLAVEGTSLATPMIDAGGSQHLDLSSLSPGTYTVFCQIQGHREAGMQAMLHLAAGGGGSETAGAGGGGGTAAPSGVAGGEMG